MINDQHLKTCSESAKDKREKYGRYLGVIFVGEKNVNLEMVQLGLASSKDY